MAENPTLGWDKVPVFGWWETSPGVPAKGSINFLVTPRIRRVDGRMVYPGGVTKTVTIGDIAQHDPEVVNVVKAGMKAVAQREQGERFDDARWEQWWNAKLESAIFTSFWASDDPDITPKGWAVTVSERIEGAQSRPYPIYTRIADLENEVPGVNLAMVEFPDQIGPTPESYTKGQPGGVAVLDADGDVVNARGVKVGVVTDEAAASLLAQDGEFKAALMGTIGATVEEKAGNVPIFGSQDEAQAWEAAHPGLTALWFDAGYTEVTATGPTWTDDDINGGGTWTTPTQEGVVYSPASGTAQPGQTVTVNATATPGHVLVGTKTWSHTFPVAATTQWFTDFTEYTVGQAPHDWSVRWGTAVNHLSVVEDADATGGVMLREDYTSTAGQNRIASWDTIGERTDVEAVMKWRASSAAAPPRIALRASADVPRTAYHGGSQNGTTDSLQKLVAATSSTDIATASRSFESDTWYVTRMRTEGTRIAVKTWRADEPEPAAWDFDATDTSIPGPGLVGFRVFPTAGVRDFDWFGVGLNGQSAPLEPVAED